MKTADYQKIAERVASSLADSVLRQSLKAAWPESRLTRLGKQGPWLKREDELSFQHAGPKFRKLLGLAPALAEAEHITSMGSARSAFLFGLASLARELDKPLTLYLLESTPLRDTGMDAWYANAWGGCDIHWVKRENWSSLASTIRSHLRPESFFVPEGGARPEALPGALTLGLDLIPQLIKHSITDLWIDAGSGYTAQVLLTALGTLCEAPPRAHVVLCAGSPESFAQGLTERLSEAKAFAPGLDWQPASYVTHRPITAAAYGSTNQTVWSKIQSFHHTQGIMLDPIYTAKLMLTFEGHPTPPASTLIIHSGGGLNNFGFVETWHKP